MHAVRIDRASVTLADLLGRLICHDLRSSDGHVEIRKGRVLDAEDSARALTLEWTELHLLALDQGDVHEEAAGHRIAHAVSGPGVEVRPEAGGHWPLAAAHRGVLAIDGDAL